MDSSTLSERAYVSACKVDRHTLPMIVEEYPIKCTPIPFLSNESGPVRKVIRPFLTAEVRLVSETSIGNGEHIHFVPGEKSAFDEQSVVRGFLSFLQQFIGESQVIKCCSSTHRL